MGISMALQKRGKWWYGESQADIRGEITRYSKLVGYDADHFADAVCKTCSGALFTLLLDDTEGVAVRSCVCGEKAHPIGDSTDFMEEAEVSQCSCPCGQELFEITVGISLYDGSDDVRWLYVGCRCPGCGLTAVYGDWKNEFCGFRELLDRI